MKLGRIDELGPDHDPAGAEFADCQQGFFTLRTFPLGGGEPVKLVNGVAFALTAPRVYLQKLTVSLTVAYTAHCQCQPLSISHMHAIRFPFLRASQLSF